MNDLKAMLEAQAQLADAVGLLRYAMESSSFREILTLERDIAAFLARHAQAKQHEVCWQCGGTGEADTGGVMPWGAPAMATCPCQRESQAEQQEAQGAQAGYAPKIPPMGKLDIPARGVPLNECHSCGWLGGENEVPGEEDQCYCPNCHSDNIDDDVNLPRLFHLVRYLARAALATQPAAGEPVAEFFVDFDTLRKALSIYGLAAPVSNEELGLQMDRQAVRVIEAVARLPFPYPPAAAHGDEAVRKDATEAVMQRACAELPEDWYIEIHLENGSGYATLFNDGIVVDFGQDFESMGAQAEAAIDAAMRAQGDGHD